MDEDKKRAYAKLSYTILYIQQLLTGVHRVLLASLKFWWQSVCIAIEAP